MEGGPLRTEISEETLAPCYFFFGEEVFLAYEFLARVREALISPDNQEYNFEKLNREDNSWADVIDLARTMPFLFSSKRIIVVDITRKKDETLNSTEKSILNDYFSSPVNQTVLIIIFHGKVNRRTPIVRFFSSFPSSVVRLEELKALRGRALLSWVEEKFHAEGKTIAFEGQKRLVEIIGSDLGRLNSEIAKINTYLDDKNLVEVDDVNEVSGWFKSFTEWEMVDSLESSDYAQGIRVLDSLFSEGTRPEYTLGLFARFFRDIFMAKVWVMEKHKERKEIFKELKPQIQEKFGSFYTNKFRQFFSLVDGLSRPELTHLLQDLEQIDLKFKTSDLSLQTLLEGFLLKYSRLRNKKGRASLKS
ncbi:DNA polymerase III subunit delta [Acidobacteriota bacterium]